MRTRAIILILLLIFFSKQLNAQVGKKPKLVVGIVVDQMRADYLYRFQDNYSEKGFKRLIEEGFNIKNMHFNYVPTATGPGHASIFTGTTPANHGIVSNNWYNRETKSLMYCAYSSIAYLVDKLGAHKYSYNFARSPKNLMTTTITDELKLFTNKRSKVVGISLKDRGAILPAGHMADYAFWFNNRNGHFITSTYYTKRLPDWLVKFNNKGYSNSLLSKKWEPLIPIENYKDSNIDDAPFERIFKEKEKSIFPYELDKLKKQNGGYQLLAQTPFGNKLLTQFARATILGESLGKGSEIDFLTISYSSTDKVGHDFGIRSKELEDTYVRLDREIEDLLTFLDSHVGKDNYLLFLTADHGGSDNPEYLRSQKLPGNFYDIKKIKEELNQKLSDEFDANKYILHMDNAQIYIDNHSIAKKLVLERTKEYLSAMDGVKDVFIPALLEGSMNISVNKTFVINSYHRKNSGDILYQMYSGWIPKKAFGTSHGSWYTSDTHVPLIFYGWQIPRGESVRQYSITQIVPTISMLLDIPLPSASDKSPIEEIFVQ